MSSSPVIRINKDYYREAKKLMSTGYYNTLEDAYRQVVIKRKAEELTSFMQPLVNNLKDEIDKQRKNSKPGGFLYG